MASSKQEGDAKYLKLTVLHFLDYRLSDWRNGWRQLAGELDYESMDVEKFETDGLKIDQSSTKLLLRDWEKRHGGCDVDHLKKCLANMGRNDILQDLKDKFEGKELVEPRSTTIHIPQYNGSMVVSPDIHVHVQPNLQPIPQKGQDVVFYVKIPIADLKLTHPPSELSPECHEVPGGLSANGGPPDHRNSYTCRSRMEPRLTDPQKRNSDPITRREVSGQSWSSGSMDNIPQESPKNLQKTHSEFLQVLTDNSTTVGVIPERTLQQPRERMREVDSHQTQRNYHSLHSIDNGRASPGKQYLLLSSEAPQDQNWCKKLRNILRKRDHQVHVLHAVPPTKLLEIFTRVHYVVVIYTENYKKEFQTSGTTNNELFQHIQCEYKRNGKINYRFIPVYDTTVIRALPDAFLQSNTDERDYILSLLRSNNRPGNETHSSAPSRNGVGGACRVGATATCHDYHARVQSDTVITREFHTPLNHSPLNNSKKSSTVKKESKTTRPWFKKDKKDR